MFNIAIDGPAGAGKSTIAKKIASNLNFIYVDTGAMYRAIALFLIRKGIDGAKEESISESIQDVKVSIVYNEGEQQVLLNGENVNSYIRNDEVGQMASIVSAYKTVREKLLQLQRDLASSSNVIMDGRDIGTFVLPNANLKIYLTASVEERAKRRHLEYMQKGITSNIDEIKAQIAERDYRDMNREIAPLKKAEDAVEIDTSYMTIDEVVTAIIDEYRRVQ